MSARRLSLGGQEDGPRQLLAGIPAPLRGQARAHSLAQVLEILLARSQVALGYDAIMALTGLAFRTPAWPGDPNPDTDEWLQAIHRLDAVLSDELTVLGAAGPPEPGEAMAAVAAAIDAGRPCAALGWGSVKDEWSVIAGYDQGRGTIAGHCVLEEPREAYESWPAEVRLLLSPPAEPPTVGASPIPHLVKIVLETRESARAGDCAAWAEELAGADEAPGPGHERAVQLLADARSAAAGFLDLLAEGDDSIPARWLAEAVLHLQEVIELIDGRVGPPFSAEAAEALADEAGRAQWAQRLTAIAEADERAFSALRVALTADFPPGEDEF